MRFSFRWKGSRALGGIFIFLSSISNFNFILCMKLFTSLCRFCIVRFFGFGMKVRPLRSKFLCVSDKAVFVARITNASSAVCG